jgi:hypothetical protein
MPLYPCCFINFSTDILFVFEKLPKLEAELQSINLIFNYSNDTIKIQKYLFSKAICQNRNSDFTDIGQRVRFSNPGSGGRGQAVMWWT